MHDVQAQGGRIPADIPSVRELIELGVDRNNPGKSQSELAREIGFAANQTSMLSMIKKGTSRLKLGRVARTAKAQVFRAVEQERGERVVMTPEKEARLMEFVRTQLFVD